MLKFGDFENKVPRMALGRHLVKPRPNKKLIRSP
jgi:hypothetical protein